MKTFRKLNFSPEFPISYLVIATCVLILTSCTNVYYESPQPYGQENLKEFPTKLTGLYTDIENNDTVITIYSDGFSMNLNENDVKIQLSDKTILRKYKSYYFLNLMQEDSLWTVHIAKPGRKKTIEIFDFSTEEADMQKLKEITEVKKIESHSDKAEILCINPDLKEMDRILESGLLKPVEKIKK